MIRHIKKEVAFFSLISLIIAVIVGNRGMTRDTLAYYSVFRNIGDYNLINPITFYNQTDMEIGYGWYSYLISLFTDSNFLLFFSFSALIFYIIYAIAKKVKVNMNLVLLLYVSSGYFAIQQFMQIRQGIAIPLALYAYCLLILENRISLRYIIISLLAMSFHQIAIVVVFAGFFIRYFVHRNKLSINNFKFLSLLVFFILVFLAKFVLQDFLSGMSSRVESYVDVESVEMFRLPNIKAFLTLILMMIFMDKKLYEDKLFIGFFIFFVFGNAFRFGFVDVAVLSGRFAVAFSYVEIFILPFIFNRFKSPVNYCFILLFSLIQAVATYQYQVPEDFYETYFQPLYL